MTDSTAQQARSRWTLAGLWALAPKSLESWPAANHPQQRLHSSGGGGPKATIASIGLVHSTGSSGGAAKSPILPRPLTGCACKYTAMGRQAEHVAAAHTRRCVGVTSMQPASGLFSVVGHASVPARRRASKLRSPSLLTA